MIIIIFASLTQKLNTMSLKCGIIGLTNTGKTTIFNCISNTKAESTRYAFSSNKSNIGIVNVPDERLYKLAELVSPQKIVHASVEIIDIPGLTKGASKGEGIGNSFLTDIRECDALIHVLRCFEDENLAHIEGSIDPVRDKEIIDLELQIKDLEAIEKKLVRVERSVKAGDKDAKKSHDALLKAKEHLENFQSIRLLDLSEEERKTLKDTFLLSDKPVLYVCNVDEKSVINGNKYVEKLKEAVKNENTEVLIIAGAMEAEISELEDEQDRKAFLEEIGLSQPGVHKLIRSAFHLLNLQTFFTAGPKEVKAWTIKKGMTAPQASGVIHSDLERGFIRAEVIKYDDYIKYKTEAAVKDAGKLGVEGKNYIVDDGDVLHIRFNV